MSKAFKAFLFSCILFSLCVSISYAQTCKSYTFTSNRASYNSCQDLPVLNSYLHWNYDQSTNKVDIAFRHNGTSTSRWISWAINPQGAKMIGSQALVAHQNSSGLIHAYTAPLTGYAVSEGSLSFAVSNLTATFENSEMSIFATLTLPSGMTNVTQVWQEGPLNGNTPGQHDTGSNAANMRSMSSLNLLD
uniref:DOMON domain-containing protein n=1 Tax=Fagus sylvatica TaxID=28930 RepID=A0A2N9GK63_FAGSY